MAARCARRLSPALESAGTWRGTHELRRGDGCYIFHAAIDLPYCPFFWRCLASAADVARANWSARCLFTDHKHAFPGNRWLCTEIQRHGKLREGAQESEAVATLWQRRRVSSYTTGDEMESSAAPRLKRHTPVSIKHTRLLMTV
ncbi:hypothetical protein F2P81_015009 [Scophthalmus maximus]|uniref:Uncharacterized protein n=1 Tax=Scophthalmus maximus TaxID=52904 RepID=A0A6A4SJK4_SCOMX|nr:hypothetical protein F2P81_015009 [Scophthalmus maximus]